MNRDVLNIILEEHEKWLQGEGGAREVFQKQTPMKPKYDHRYTEMGCAFCGNMVRGWEESPDYCPQCGQAIDWED